MNRENIIIGICAIVTTLQETGQPTPIGPMYAAASMNGMTFTEFQCALEVIKRLDIAKVGSEMATFTKPAPGSKGEELMNEIVRIQSADYKATQAEMN